LGSRTGLPSASGLRAITSGLLVPRLPPMPRRLAAGRPASPPELELELDDRARLDFLCRLPLRLRLLRLLLSSRDRERRFRFLLRSAGSAAGWRLGSPSRVGSASCGGAGGGQLEQGSALSACEGRVRPGRGGRGGEDGRRGALGRRGRTHCGRWLASLCAGVPKEPECEPEIE
jgi:hypothetical protein